MTPKPRLPPRKAPARWASIWVLALGLSVAPRQVDAFTGVLVGKDDARYTVRNGQVVLLRREELSVVTVTADFVGPVGPLVWILPVPADVTRERVRNGRREFIARLEQLTAPRYHEFFEKDPCEPGEAEQEWEYRPKVEEPGLQVGTRLLPRDSGPIPREMGIPLLPVFGDAERPSTFHVLTRPHPGQLREWLERRGYRLRSEAEHRLELDLVGQNLLLAEIDPQRLGLVPGGAELTAIRYWSEQPLPAIPARLGLLHTGGRQDLIVYVLAPGQRYAALNYENLVLPSNLSVAPGANERLSELHDGLTRALLARHPRTTLTEFVWATDGCGEPCPDGKLLPHELLSLGGDVVEERLVSAAERAPPPAPETPEEASYWNDKRKAAKPAERSRLEREHQQYRKELARRRALVGRHRYVLTRLRWSYGPTGLPEDPRIGPAPPIQGGVGTPRGPNAELEREARPAAESRYQVRYLRARPWALPSPCEESERWRWGRRWASQGRTWRKVWTATSLGRARSGPADPKALLITPLPEIGWGISPAPPPVEPPRPSGRSGCACPPGPLRGCPRSWAVLGCFWLLLRCRRPR